MSEPVKPKVITPAQKLKQEDQKALVIENQEPENSALEARRKAAEKARIQSTQTASKLNVQ